MKFIHLFPLLLLLLVSACKNDPTSSYEELDLLSYGMAISVKAPPGAEVGKDDLGFVQGVWIKSDTSYYIQIYGSTATVTDIQKLKQERMSEVKAGRYFSKIIEEETDGFIFEKDIDGVIRYDFRRVKVVGDKEFTFQKGLTGNFSEGEVRGMYAAVK